MVFLFTHSRSPQNLCIGQVTKDRIVAFRRSDGVFGRSTFREWPFSDVQILRCINTTAADFLIVALAGTVRVSVRLYAT